MTNNACEQYIRTVPNYEEQYFQKGQKVVYEGKDAQIISVKPFLVIKTEERVVCGALREVLHAKNNGWAGS